MKSSRAFLIIGAGVCWHNLRSTTFVPLPTSRSLPPVAAAGTLAVLGAAPAFADEIDVAAEKLAKAAYPFLKEVNWLDDKYATIPSSTPQAALKAIEKALVMGAAMDPAELKKECWRTVPPSRALTKMELHR